MPPRLASVLSSRETAKSRLFKFLPKTTPLALPIDQWGDSDALLPLSFALLSNPMSTESIREACSCDKDFTRIVDGIQFGLRSTVPHYGMRVRLLITPDAGGRSDRTFCSSKIRRGSLSDTVLDDCKQRCASSDFVANDQPLTPLTSQIYHSLRKFALQACTESSTEA
jgi:hypothetical protein